MVSSGVRGLVDKVRCLSYGNGVSRDKEQRLLQMFNGSSRLGALLGIKLSFDEQDHAVLELPYNPRLDHSRGGTHGGVIATLLDNAGWFTCAAAHPGDGWVATTELTVHLLRPALRTDLRATGELLKVGKRQGVARMECRDSQGQLVAHGVGTFVYLDNLPLEPTELRE